MIIKKSVFIVGPPGAGKTTLLKRLNSPNKAKFFDEIIQNRLLEEFHNNRSNEINNFLFQLSLLNSRANQYLDAYNLTSYDTIYFDFHIDIMSRIFTNFFDDPELKKLYFSTEKLITDQLKNNNRTKYFIFLNASVDILLDRIRKRSGTADRLVTKETIKRIRDDYLIQFQTIKNIKKLIDTSLENINEASKIITSFLDEN